MISRKKLTTTAPLHPMVLALLRPEIRARAQRSGARYLNRSQHHTPRTARRYHSGGFAGVRPWGHRVASREERLSPNARRTDPCADLPLGDIDGDQRAEMA